MKVIQKVYDKVVQQVNRGSAVLRSYWSLDFSKPDNSQYLAVL